MVRIPGLELPFVGSTDAGGILNKHSICNSCSTSVQRVSVADSHYSIIFQTVVDAQI